MRDFSGNVAVVTGAGSGIGRALAERFAHEGMKIVLADVQDDALRNVVEALRAGGAEALDVRCDVSRAEDVEALARRTIDAYGAVHILCNNAGVSAGARTWESTLDDWRWTLGVNLWGVIHGLHTFVPLMLAQGDECHVSTRPRSPAWSHSPASPPTPPASTPSSRSPRCCTRSWNWRERRCV
jgi:NAD(P)-dependent dehydrogenase (short-subunit alcohol dehydrogenase family)